MAQTPYAGGVADVQPDTRAPDDYQKVQATPGAFGAAIAKGGAELGQGAEKAGQFWGQIQTDDASNNYQKEASALAEHIRTLNGQDALNAQAGVNDQLDALYAKYKGQLNTPAQQLQFDNQNRPFTDRYIRGQLNTHFIQQGQAFGIKTADDAIGVSANMAATAGADGSLKDVAVARAKAFDAEKKKLQLNGQERDPDALALAGQRADQTAYKSAVEAQLVKDPEKALAWTEQFKDRLGTAYEPLAAKAKETVARTYVSKAEEIAVTNPKGAQEFVEANQDKFGPFYGAALSRTKEAVKKQGGQDWQRKAADAVNNGWQPGGVPVGYSYEKAVMGGGSYGPGESSGNAGIVNNTPYTDERGVYHPHGTGAGGLFQFEPGTWRGLMERHPELGLTLDGFHDNSEAGKSQQLRAMHAFTQENRQYLSSQGIEPTDKNAYMAHFLGAGGAVQFISAAHANPNQIAAQLFPAEAAANFSVFYEGKGSEARPRTLGEIYANMTRKFPGVASVAQGAPGAAVMPAAYEPSGTEEAPPTAPESPTATDATFHPDQALQPPAPITDPVELANANYAKQLRFIDEYTPADQKEIAKAAAYSAMQFAMAEANETASQRKAREEAATNDVLGDTMKGNFTSAYKKVSNYSDDVLPPKAKMALEDVIERRSGDPNPLTFGSKYIEMFNHVIAPSDDPNRISNRQDIYQAEARGDLTARGSERLLTVMEGVRKGTDEIGLHAREQGVLNYASDYLDKSVDTPYLTVKDPEGKKKLELDFTQTFYSQLDAWRNQGKDVASFPLFDRKKLDEYLHWLRPRAQIDQFVVEAGASGPEPAGTPMPAPPETVAKPEGWSQLMANAPPWKGVVNHQLWASKLNQLIADPATMGPLWDASPIGKKLPSRQVFDMLGIKHEEPPGEGVTGGERLATGPDEQPHQWRLVVPGAGIRPGAVSELGKMVQVGPLNLGGALNPEAARDVAAAGRMLSSPDFKKMTPEERRRYFGVRE